MIKQGPNEIEIEGDRGTITLQQEMAEDVAYLRWWEDEITGFTFKLPGWVGRALDTAIRRSGGRTITMKLDQRSIDQLRSMIDKAIEQKLRVGVDENDSPYVSYEDGKGFVDV